MDIIKSVKDNCRDTMFSLVVDSMSIRKRLIVNKGDNAAVDGLVNLGCDFTHESEKKLASEGLVFLLVPLLSRGRFPVGYFLVDKIDATAQAYLIKQCLELTAEHGLRIINVTCDGCAANISTLQKLGARIPEQPKFKHPTDGYYVSSFSLH